MIVNVLSVNPEAIRLAVDIPNAKLDEFVADVCKVPTIRCSAFIAIDPNDGTATVVLIYDQQQRAGRQN